MRNSFCEKNSGPLVRSLSEKYKYYCGLIVHEIIKNLGNFRARGNSAGLDRSRVMPLDYEVPVKSIGHGVTCTVDLNNADEVWKVMLELAQDIASCAQETKGASSYFDTSPIAAGSPA